MPSRDNVSQRWVLAVFVCSVLGAGFTIGYLDPPGRWYADLNKPWFNPPGWIFGPVWSILYLLVAIAGWRSWIRRRDGIGMKLWAVQMALNFVWSPIFFTFHAIGTALAVVTALLALIVAYAATQWSEDRVSAVLFLPYAIWVGFATLLNASVFLLN